jgi:uncharacterized protein (TIGR02217 family)
MQRSVTGRELRVQDYVTPVYVFTLRWESLKDAWDQRIGYGIGSAFVDMVGGQPYNDLRVIWNFYLQQLGPTIPFQFNDVPDNTTRLNPSVAQFGLIGYGDGTTTTFQMISPLMAPVIPATINSIVVGGVTIPPTSGYTLNIDTGQIIFTTPPASNALVQADYNFHYKVRFSSDSLEAEEFYYQFWQMRQLKLQTVYE